MDPYCVVKCGSDIHKTKVHEGAGKIPRWNEHFIFDIQGSEVDISLTVMDKDMMNDDIVGQTTVNLSDIEKKAKYCGWYDLEYK
jgi:Ca2+-dependent lipid-binding protein